MEYLDATVTSCNVFCAHQQLVLSRRSFNVTKLELGSSGLIITCLFSCVNNAAAKFSNFTLNFISDFISKFISWVFHTVSSILL